MLTAGSWTWAFALLLACTLARPAPAQTPETVAALAGPAAAGDAEAQYRLGRAYKLGRGAPRDLARATDWFRRAAAQGHRAAGDDYGLVLFQTGRKAEALPWLEASVARDERRAELVLGTMLFNGDVAAKDWPRAYALVARASQQGLPQGRQTLAQMDRYVPEAQRSAGLAMARTMATRAQPPVPAAALPVAAPAPAPAASVAGGWRIQLGAFRDDANARQLWAQVGARTGGSASYVRGGDLTRLQATGFATRGEAQAACARAGGGCVVLAP